MSTKLIARGFVTAVALLTLATPALAQAIKGRVLNDKGRPVSEADVVATCVSTPSLRPAGATTDSDGRFVVQGLQIGKWDVQIVKGNMGFKVKEPLSLLPNSVNDIGDVTLTALPTNIKVASSKAEADERNKKMLELQEKFKAANADMDAGKFDDAITKLTAVAKDVEKCAACSAKIGEAYLKKDDLANAEKAFLQSIEYDPASPDPYKALATIYNAQQKFDEALKMTAKASEMNTAKGGPVDPTALYNEGVVLWNAGKIAEAEPVFKKVTELDPKNSGAFFQLGMAQVNQGKIPDAIKSFETYLKLAPTGKDADTAKGILSAIKK